MDSDSTVQEAAISRLPPEILAACFLWCIDIEGPLPTYDPDTSPVKLTFICRSWRAVALSTPRLWARLHFKASCLDSRTPEELAKLSLFLERSRAAPLTYTIDFGNPDVYYRPVRNVDSLRRILKLLIRHAGHWYDMILQDREDSHRYPDTMAVAGDISFPLLRQLSCWGLYEGIEQLTFTAERAPSLESVTLSIPRLRAWTIPFSELRSLFILDWDKTASIQDILDVLSQCSHLHDLRINSDTVEPVDLLSGRRVELRTLTYFSLNIGLASSKPTSVILGALSFPALTHLSISRWAGSVDGLISFLSRHSATIQTLDLNTWHGSAPNAYPRMWTSLPNLKYLWLQSSVGKAEELLENLRSYYSGCLTYPPSSAQPQAIHLKALTLMVSFRIPKYAKHVLQYIIESLLSIIPYWDHDNHPNDTSSDDTFIGSRRASMFKLHLRLALGHDHRRSLRDEISTWGGTVQTALQPLLEQQHVSFTYDFAEMVMQEQPWKGSGSTYHLLDSNGERLVRAEELIIIPVGRLSPATCIFPD